MMPPECIICQKSFNPGKKSGLIHFKKSDSDVEWDKKMEEQNMSGHPPYVAWFCKKHFKKAIKYKDLIIKDALSIINPKK